MVNPKIRRIFTGLAIWLISTPAVAEVCDKLRPDWDGEPVSAIGVAISLFASPISLILLIATAFAIRFRSQWGALAVVLGWTVNVSLISMVDPGGVRQIARVEGCIGSPALFIGLVAAICAGMIIYTMPRETRL